MTIGQILVLLLLISGPIFIILWGISQYKLINIRNKYAPIHSIQNEIERLHNEANATRGEIVEVRKTYSEKRKLLDTLMHQVAIYDERLAFAELGVYEPHFDFGDSEKYKARILEIRQRQKDMVSDKKATTSPLNWTVDGSKAKGQSMVNRQIRLTLRAFNNECEAAIANARWNNVVAMEKRILTSANTINKENTSMGLLISDEYVRLKLEELFLTHEYREQQKIEKDERVEMARAEREEKKLIEEAAKAEREEQRYKTLLDKAKQEAGLDSDNQALKDKVALLEQQLSEAHSVTERARAMAEMTRSGYVYIISNIGSFGEDIFKIGLTRRLDPDDRVRELGDASVPFTFDTHAMIYSEEAPALEAALHNAFADRRVNMSNFRKEFFRVNLEEVESAVARLAPEAIFFKDREAQEWHETLSRRNQMLKDQTTPIFPESI